jgi:hypothetical protein
MEFVVGLSNRVRLRIHSRDVGSSSLNLADLLSDDWIKSMFRNLFAVALMVWTGAVLAHEGRSVEVV